MSGNLSAFVSLTGIDMAHEVWELLRLFHDKDQIFFKIDSIWENHDKSLSKTCMNLDGNTVLYAITLTETGSEAEKHTKTSTAKVQQWQGFFAEIAVKIKDKLVFHEKITCTDAEALSPKGFLWANRKIRIGAALIKGAEQIVSTKTDWGSLTGVRPVKLVHMAFAKGLSRQETKELLSTATNMQPEKAELLLTVADVQKPYLTEQTSQISVYVGIPFCASRCLYCSFPSWTTDRYGHEIPAYLEALQIELEHASKLLKQFGKKLDSVYVGGGTPTVLDAMQLDTLLKHMQSRLDIGSDVEFTVEAGRPDSITEEKLDVMRRHGVNRISINPQTMHHPTLHRIGRRHSPEQVITCFKWARNAGFETINMDLIAGLPGEDASIFQKTLDTIVSLNPENLTIHTMAVKRASRLNEEQNHHEIVTDTVVSEMIRLGAETALQMGMMPYYLYRQKNILANLENIGYAKSGHVCHYNVQTMEEQQSILAIGAGAISKRVDLHPPSIERCMNVSELSHYMKRLPEMLQRKEKLFGVQTDEQI